MSIKVKNLVKFYDKNLALDRLELTVTKGSIFGLIGPNGAGKSTLISILMGLTPFDKGEIFIDNKNIKDDIDYIKSISSFVPQNLAFYPTLTVFENLEFFGGIIGLTGKNLKSKIEHTIDITKLQKVTKSRTHTLSGGLQRRLNIAIGLLNEPKIIYLDEPTVGIDPQSRNFILEAIKQMRSEDKIVLYTSHYMQEVEQLCDEIAIIDNGKIIKHGKLQDILNENTTAKVVCDDNSYEVSLDQLPSILDDFIQNNKTVKSIDYGHNLEKYFLNLTNKELRD